MKLKAALAGVIAVGLVVLAAFLLTDTDDDPRPVPPIADRPATAIPSQLLDHFAVLRRPRKAADRLSAHAPAARGADVNPQLSRLIATAHGAHLWLVPGRHTVCLVESLTPRGGGSAGCGVPSASIDAHRPLASVTVGPRSWRPHRRIISLLLPDGSGSVRLERSGAVIRRVPIQANGVMTRSYGATRISWRAPDGTRRRLTIR